MRTARADEDARWCTRGEGSASDEAHPTEENRRADEDARWCTGGEGSASDEAHPTEENRRADEGGHQDG
jgi:hypothetical protein